MFERNTMGLTLIITAILFSGVSTLAGDDNSLPEIFKVEAKIIQYKADADLFPASKGDNALIEESILKKLLQNKGVDLISAPAVCARSGQDALICVQSELHYFEAGKNDNFVLKKLPDNECPGIRIKTVMTPAADDKVKLAVDFRMNTLKGRVPIEGVTSPDAGKPIMQVSTVSKELTLSTNHWFMVGDKQLKDVKSGELEKVVILARITIPENNPHISDKKYFSR